MKLKKIKGLKKALDDYAECDITSGAGDIELEIDRDRMEMLFLTYYIKRSYCTAQYQCDEAIDSILNEVQEEFPIRVKEE